MPNPAPAPHAEHDLLLVAAHAAGDLEPADRTTADALLASCADCRSLASDLRAIAQATATLPAPVRTRDFALRPQDAARLRPRGWRRLAAALGPARLELMRPLAPVLMTLGLVGLLVSGLPLLQVGAGASSGTAAAAPAAGASDSTQRSRAAAAASGAASAAPAASGPYGDQFGPTVKSTGPGASGVADAGSQPSSAPADVTGEQGATATTTPIPEAASATPAAIPAPGPDFRLAAISAMALIAGLVLFGLRRAARTTSRN